MIMIFRRGSGVNISEKVVGLLSEIYLHDRMKYLYVLMTSNIILDPVSTGNTNSNLTDIKYYWAYY